MTTIKKKKAKHLAEFRIEKKGLDIELYLKVLPEIEEWFRRISNNEINTSTRWKDMDDNGLQFYKKSDEYYQPFNYTFDDFGQGIARNGNYNIALLRIVGISKGVRFKATEHISLEEFKKALEVLSHSVKSLYADYIAKTTLKALITYEI